MLKRGVGDDTTKMHTMHMKFSRKKLKNAIKEHKHNF